jgi:hypothetical protein
MAEARIEFGGGHLPPTVKAHVARTATTQSQMPASKTEFGGGHTPPTVKTHIARDQGCKRR